MSERSIRVLCVDDAPDIAELFQRLIAREPGLEAAGLAHSADTLTDDVARSGADVVLLDLRMPGEDPLAATRRLVQEQPSCRVIIFSGMDDPRTRDEALDAGASGYLVKDCDPGEVIAAIRAVAAGEVYLRGGA